MRNLLLAIDVGNTSSVFGLYDLASDQIITSWQIATRRDRMPDEWFSMLVPLFQEAGAAIREVSAAIISSVVPPLTDSMTAMVRQRLQLDPIIVGPDLDLGIGIHADNPRELGADRIVNTIAAFDRYGGPAIVVDFGTATNFDVVSADGDYLGGAIAPGLVISLEALTSRAARLFNVELRLPDRAIGTNTVACLQSGVVLGYLGMIEGLIRRIWTELGTNAQVIATGGYSSIFSQASPLITHHDPELLTHGLLVIYRRVTA